MARMDGQIPDDVKQSRVEELMLAQQDVAFAKSSDGRQDDRSPDRSPRRAAMKRTASSRARSAGARTSTRSFRHGDNLHPASS
jgi:hypothetical protein